MKNIILFLSLCCSFPSIAQNFKMEWGKIAQADVDLKQVEFDSSASAVIMGDIASVSAHIGNGVLFNRYTRIKILTEGGKEHADIAVPYYHSDNSEWVSNVQAQVINVVDGKPVISKLDKKDFFRVKINDRWSELRFTFPKVAVGSIIEYKYTSESKNYTTLESWSFQNQLPTLHSSFKALIGERLTYSIMYQGPRLIDKYGNQQTNVWELDNLPGIKGAAFCPNPFDFTEKIKFQLAKYYTNGTIKEVMRSWEDVTYDLIKDSDIRTYLNKKKDAKKILEDLLDGTETPTDKIQKIYTYLTSNFEWSGKYWYYPSEKYDDFFESKTGNSVEINLLFVNLLAAAGIEAYPAALSTKEHGFVAKDITFFSQFNNLIACARIDGKDVLLDATSPLRPYTLLDQEYLNADVLVLRKKDPYWLKVEPHSRNQSFKMVEMKMPSPGLLAYNVKLKAKGYEAEDLRYNFLDANRDPKGLLQENILAQETEFKINSSEVKNFQEIDKAFGVEAEVENTTGIVVNDDFVYINPFVDAAPASNPFNDKQRHLPVDLYYPFEEVLFIQFKIPEGYDIIELPEGANITTEQGKCKYSFSAEQIGEAINIRLTFKVIQPFFSAYEYGALREIYDRYLEKRQEQIVLKRSL